MANYPAVREFFEDEREHRRQIAKAANAALCGRRADGIRDITLDSSANQTVIEWVMLTPDSMLMLMPLSQTAGDVLAETHWFEFSKGTDHWQVTIHHASNVATDLNCRMIVFT